jgi:hypothetical protein
MEKKIFKLIERNSVKIEESGDNGIIAHHVEVDDLIGDLAKLFTAPKVGNYNLITEKEPKKNQSILYMGNLGLSEGSYRNRNNGIGWVCLPNGGIDCFDKWKLNER